MSGTEDKNQDQSIAVMANDIGYIKRAIEKIDERLEVMDSHYIKRDEVQTIKDTLEKSIEDHEKRLKDMELGNAVFQAQVKTWGTVAIIASGIVQFLIGKFL